jgi:hypothetical protein
MTEAEMDSETVFLNHKKITKKVKYQYQFNNT